MAKKKNTRGYAASLNRNKSSLQKKIDKLKKPGRTYTKAQLLALKRKAQNKTIAQVKAENEEKMRDRARKRHAEFKKTGKQTFGGKLKIKSDSKKNNKTAKKSGLNRDKKDEKKNLKAYEKIRFLK